MIQLSRSLARQLRAVFRRLATRSAANSAKVILITGTNGLDVRLHRTDILCEYHQYGAFSAEEVELPLNALGDFEGKTNDLVTLETDGGQVQARWEDAGIPRVVSYDGETATKSPAFPSCPDLSPVDGSFLTVLANASASASHDNVRYATNHIQLNGSANAVVATDGRQLLQTRFPLPFTDEVLIPASSIYGCKEFQQDQVNVGKTDTHLVLQTGPWTLYFPIEKNGRFPKVESVIPKEKDAVTHCTLDAEDREFLGNAISRLPGADDNDAPVTVDLNGEVCLRAKAANQDQTVELVLSRSTATGKALRFLINRNYVSRAVELGLSELHVEDAAKAVLFQGDRAQFVVMPLTDGKPLEPSDQAVRITSAKEDSQETSTQHRRPRLAERKVSSNGTGVNGHGANGSSVNGNGARAHVGRTRKVKNTGFVALIEEATSLKQAIRELCSRSHKLLMGLKRQRKQTRIVQSSLKALQDLQHIEA